MEEVFSLLFVTRDFKEIFSKGKGRRSHGIRKEIDDFLRLVLKLFNSIETEVDDTLYDMLVAKLQPNDTIITLSYDTLIDTALWKKGWDPKRGYDLSGSGKKIRWSPKQLSTHLKEVKLLKLHGSLNWHLSGNVQKLEKVFKAKPKSVTAPRSNNLGGHLRQIIPPVFGKAFDHGHWKNLWLSAYSALLSADRIIVVGCSLVDTDSHLVGLLSRVTPSRNGKLKEFVIVDQSDSVKTKWYKIFKSKSAHKRIHVNNFSDFSRQYLRE